jgi:hypothetical protein
MRGDDRHRPIGKADRTLSGAVTLSTANRTDWRHCVNCGTFSNRRFVPGRDRRSAKHHHRAVIVALIAVTVVQATLVNIIDMVAVLNCEQH